eukprot:jgi/Mesvir1/28257/Mv04793-RA.1
MQGVVLERFGGSRELKFREGLPIPSCRPGEVLVRVLAAAVNPLDARIRAGYGRRLFEPWLPLVLGRDLSGVVVGLGERVRRLREGQPVFGALPPTARHGAYCEYVAVEERHLAVKPDSLTHEAAAAIPFAALTAWRAVMRDLAIRRGDRLLVLGGGSAVGGAAVQLAAACGAHVVATCRAGSVERVKTYGAADVVTQPERSQSDWSVLSLIDQLRTMQPFSACLDTLGTGGSQSLALDLLPQGGRFTTLHGPAVKRMDAYGLVAGAAAAALEFGRASLALQSTRGISLSWTVMCTDDEAIQHIKRMAEAGSMVVPVGTVLPLHAAADAHALLEGEPLPAAVTQEQPGSVSEGISGTLNNNKILGLGTKGAKGVGKIVLSVP